MLHQQHFKLVLEFLSTPYNTSNIKAYNMSTTDIGGIVLCTPFKTFAQSCVIQPSYSGYY